MFVDPQLFAETLAAAERKGIHVADPTPPRRVICTVNGLELSLLDWQGDHRPQMLLLHGALLQSHLWDFFCLNMRQHFHIRALDLPGHGDSGWARDGDYSRARVAQDVVKLVEQLHMQSFVLIGHSFGGAVAALMATALSDRVRALVMVDSTLVPSGRPSVRARAAELPPSFESFDEFARHAARLGRRTDPQRPAPSLRWNARQLDNGHWTWKYDPVLRHTAPSPTELSDVWDALHAFPGPVLFVRAGEHSHLAEEAAERLRALPRVRLVVVPAASHNVMSDDPLAFTREVADFLATPRL
jgi:pimeloyl-ACP methyl ester carboxylesterase